MQITILSPDAQQYYQLLAPQFPHCEWFWAEQTEQLSQAALHSQVLLAAPADAAAILNDMPQLTWLHSTFAGVDALLDTALPRHYQLTNSRGVFGPLMSEYVFSHLLALTQQHQAYRAQQAQRLWQALPHQSLQGKTFCCIGSGNISQHLATTAAHFAMKPIALSYSGQTKAPFEQVFSFQQGLQACRQADVVVAVLPNTQATHNILNQQFFEHLADEVIFFNVGRGATVDHQALLAFLQQKPKARAIIDVCQPEPLPEDHPLWQQSNCIITPHIAAPSRVSDISRLFAEKLKAYLAGQELPDKVDFTKGY
ncbi:D-2-hydroxyacid dehydrogenase [Agarivorans gilvus]|uniref:2-hydroxyacid dehydrogenase n=1 Tax=Agarivorans gilvus TaxID=680279 RepID=A0ABQ1I5J8_9ALTE|nr:D-2-hydroxyacid dehydrogenase [Agarivorans gilvus]GGB17331.1 2-hydroxyacid dehydrogenase [Agarivorans gilvus]